ncbi:MAG: GNAT family N-acetyltransferase [Flavobacteriales bacterium]|nr:GNAT family N-acetyltransferase [Flavobacteriales bacterium]
MKTSCLTNLIQLYELIEQTTSNTIVRNDQLKSIICPHSSWPNMIYEIDTNPTKLENTIQAIQSRVSRNKLPPYCMFDSNLLDKEAFEQFSSVVSENRYWDYMEYNLNESILLQDLPHFTVKQIQTNLEILDWVLTMENSIMKGRKLDPELFLDLNKHDDVEYYLGYENEIPVAGSMLFKKDDIAGVYMIGTLEKFQRKGYGSALTQYVLKRGFELNCKKAILQATNVGAKLYRKLGFTIEGRIELFNLRPNL